MAYPDTNLVNDEIDPECGGQPANRWGKLARLFVDRVQRFLSQAHLDYNRQPYKTVVVTMSTAGLVGQAVVVDTLAVVAASGYRTDPATGSLASTDKFLGILLENCSNGAKAKVAFSGIVPQAVTGLPPGAPGNASIDTTTGKLKAWVSGEVIRGTIDQQGNVVLDPAAFNSQAGPSGKEIVGAAVDTVSVTFAGGFAYATATGANGYVMERLAVYVNDGLDPVRVSITTKTTTGFTLTFDRTFTGEIDWATRGTP